MNRTPLRTLPFALLLLAGCGPTTQDGAARAWDVRGNYALTHENRLTVKLDVGGAVRERTASGTDTVDFGSVNGQPVTLDLAAFCAKPEVQCPSETLWKQVAVDVQEVERDQALHVVQFVRNDIRDLSAGQKAEVVGGLVDHSQEDRFLLGLGARSAGQGNCGAIAISLAGGRFTRLGERMETKTTVIDATGKACTALDGGVSDAGVALDGGFSGDGGCTVKSDLVRVIPAGAPVNGIAEGKVALGFLGACAFGPALVGATLTIESPFTGLRTGPFDPPPYTPIPPQFADGGTDGGALDAGPLDGGTGDGG